jgi:hypothetical protein
MSDTGMAEADQILRAIALYEAARRKDEDAFAALMHGEDGSLSDPVVMREAYLEALSMASGLLSMLRVLETAGTLPPDWTGALRSAVLTAAARG